MKVIHNTHAALSEPPLEKHPALQAKHRVCVEGLHYMELTAFYSNKIKNLEELVGGANSELLLCNSVLA